MGVAARSVRVIDLGLVLHLPKGMIAHIFPLQHRNFYLDLTTAVVTSTDRGEAQIVAYNHGKHWQHIPANTVLVALALSAIPNEQLHTRAGPPPYQPTECTLEWVDEGAELQKKKIALTPRRAESERSSSTPFLDPLILDEEVPAKEEPIGVSPIHLSNLEDGWQVVGRPWPRVKKEGGA